MDLLRIPQWICIGPWSLIHFSYHARWLLLVRPKFNFLSWFDAHESFGVKWSVRFIVGSICWQFCSCWCACIIRIWFWLINWLFFFCCFFWRSGLLECWKRSYVRGHWYGCTLYSKTLGFIFPFVVIDPTNQRATTVVAPGRMLATFYLSTTQNPCLCTVWVICTDPNGTCCVLFVQNTGVSVVLFV